MEYLMDAGSLGQLEAECNWADCRSDLVWANELGIEFVLAAKAAKVVHGEPDIVPRL